MSKCTLASTYSGNTVPSHSETVKYRHEDAVWILSPSFKRKDSQFLHLPNLCFLAFSWAIAIQNEAENLTAIHAVSHDLNKVYL